MKKVFEKQLYHLLGIIILLAAAYYSSSWSGFYDGQLWGISTFAWFWISIAVVIVQQFFVWFTWRTELHHGLISGWLGKKAFDVYAAIFVILLLARGLLPWFVGAANQGTWNANPVFLYLVALIILFPLIYTFYSIVKYFTFRRAFGADHFDETYRNKPMVREGIFKYTDNAMYTFGFLAIWLPALIFSSEAALVLAAFSHLAVWLHYFTVEKPDIKIIYKS